MKKLGLFSQIGDKFGAVGAIVAAIGCAMCFPLPTGTASRMNVLF